MRCEVKCEGGQNPEVFVGFVRGEERNAGFPNLEHILKLRAKNLCHIWYTLDMRGGPGVIENATHCRFLGLGLKATPCRVGF